MKTIDEMIAVMTAFKEGKEVEYYDHLCNKWIITGRPIWSWDTIDYRIKSEEQKPTYRPYTYEELKEEVLSGITKSYVKEIGFNRTDLIIGFDKNGVKLTDWWETKVRHSLEWMLMNYTWLDGTPFGRREE